MFNPVVSITPPVEYSGDDETEARPESKLMPPLCRSRILDEHLVTIGGVDATTTLSTTNLRHNYSYHHSHPIPQPS